MNMEVSIREIGEGERFVIENLFTYYIYDLSEFVEIGPNEKGQFTFKSSSLDLYWQREDHIPYFVYIGAALAGFVLVRMYPDNEDVYDIEQFFILRKHKGKGVGKRAFKKTIELHKGLWQIRVLIENTGALGFWKSVVSSIVGCEFDLTREKDADLIMYFLRFEV